MSDQDVHTRRVSHAVLLAAITDIFAPPTYLASSITIAVKSTAHRLCIVLVSQYFEDPSSASSPLAEEQVTRPRSQPPPISHIERWDDIQRLLTYVYVEATKIAQDMDKVLMDIDVLLKGNAEDLPEELFMDAELVYTVRSADSVIPYGISPSAREIPEEALTVDQFPPPNHPPPTRSSQPPLLPVAALGGTFDHLHAGHKILLSMGAWISSEKLIVGITDDVLLVKKANREVLESISVRMQRTRSFLELFKPGLQYDIVPISDVYGPTAWDANIQALVVSKETLPGASSIHKIRQERRLPPLRTFVIDVISATEASLDHEDAEVLKKAKMSSTYIREWIVRHPNQGTSC